MHQRYRDRTNLLDTVFATGTGVVVVTDFMPVDEHTVVQHAKPHNHPRVIRLVECLAGEVTMHHVFDPAPGFARLPVKLSVEDGQLHADAQKLHLCLSSTVELDGPDDTLSHAGDRCSRLRPAHRRGGALPGEAVEHRTRTRLAP